MLGERGRVLYVGKAKDLHKRIGSYVHEDRLSTRIRKMVHCVRTVEVTLTFTEVEALLLEASLIKRHRPPYNILLKDDKSPHFITLSDHDFPQLSKQRKPDRKRHDVFGPFLGDVKSSLTALHASFLLRNCTDNAFKLRKRPCLQYDIRRCSAPCVGKITKSDYGALVQKARLFLAGKGQGLLEELHEQMGALSRGEAFEKAAVMRDRIAALKKLQVPQHIHVAGLRDSDVIAVEKDDENNMFCAYVFSFRGTINRGGQAFFFQNIDNDATAETILSFFLMQFYKDILPPGLILTSHIPDHLPTLHEAISFLHDGAKFLIATPCKGQKLLLVKHAQVNAIDALSRNAKERASDAHALTELQRFLGLEHSLHRIEIYDNSHLRGDQAVGVLVVMEDGGFDRRSYRTFRLPPWEDDYGMMRCVLERRFTPDAQGECLLQPPDLILLDGGKGQLSVGRAVLASYGLDIPIAAVSKDPERKGTFETLHLQDGTSHVLSPCPLLYFVQRLRDEAHRFAISAHRSKKRTASLASQLHTIEGLGSIRRKKLLTAYGSPEAIGKASVSELQEVAGVSRTLAETIIRCLKKDT